MKYANVLLIPFLVSLLLAPLAGNEAADPSEPVAREEQVRLAEDSVTRYAVVVGDEETSTAAERFAAEELAFFLQKITGATFPIVKEDEYEGPGIYVGQTQRAAGIGVDFGELGEEEWVLRTTKDDLILTGGRPRGTLYAVYEFLETQAGCRWVTPNIEVIPVNRDLAIPTLDTRGQPGFAWRETTLYPRHDDPKRFSKEDYARFLVRNRYNGGSFWLNEPRFGFAVRFGRPGSHRPGGCSATSTLSCQLPQGHRKISLSPGKDLGQEVRIPPARAALHGDPLLAWMLLK